METAIVLILIEIIIVLANLRLFRGDIFNPATISSIGFLISTLMALYCSDVWDFVLSGSTVLVITIGLLSMTIGDMASKRIRIGNRTERVYGDSLSGVGMINLSFRLRAALFMVVVLCTVMYGLESYRVGILNGGTSRNAFAYMKYGYLDDDLSKMNVIIRQGFKVVMAGAYISAFIFANNVLVLRDSLKRNITYLVCMICAFAITIFSAARTEILRVVLALLLDYVVLWRMKYGRTRIQNKKSAKVVIKKLIPIFLAVVIIAFVSRAVVKTSGGVSEVSSIIYYLAYYIGNSIAVLNTKIGVAFSDGSLIWGSTKSVSEFVYLGKLSYGGNVATICWASLYEHGIIYMFFRILILYFVGGCFYKTIIKHNINSKRNNFQIILFSFIYYIYAMSYYSDILSMKNIPTLVFTALVLIAGYRVLMKSGNVNS